MTDDIEQIADRLAATDLIALSPGVVMTGVHPATECAGREIGCWVHNPSDWPLNTAPVFWEPIQGRAYRRCEHGTLHRDLDDYRWQTRYKAKWSGMPPWCCPDETACGCCRANVGRSR